MIEHLRRYASQTVTVFSTGARNAYGAITHSTAGTAYPCRVEHTQRMVVGPAGEEVLATKRVFVFPTTNGANPTVTVRHKMTLPDGTVPDVLAVDRHIQPTSTATHHTVVYCG